LGTWRPASPRHRGAELVIGIDLVPERLERARSRGVDVVNVESRESVVAAVRELTGGRGPDAVIDAVGMEARRITTGPRRTRGGLAAP
jgi:threonine dehydrogenase-like Zn-dependent dehydrogenase